MLWLGPSQFSLRKLHTSSKDNISAGLQESAYYDGHPPEGWYCSTGGLARQVICWGGLSCRKGGEFGTGDHAIIDGVLIEVRVSQYGHFTSDCSWSCCLKIMFWRSQKDKISPDRDSMRPMILPNFRSVDSERSTEISILASHASTLSHKRPIE